MAGLGVVAVLIGMATGCAAPEPPVSAAPGPAANRAAIAGVSQRVQVAPGVITTVTLVVPGV